jgi:hypothetical protein
MSVRITLTDRQARYVLEACEWAENEDFPRTDSINACYIRIENKIKKALASKGEKDGE